MEECEHHTTTHRKIQKFMTFSSSNNVMLCMVDFFEQIQQAFACDKSFNLLPFHQPLW